MTKAKSFPEKFSEKTHRAFAPRKLIRDGVALDVIKRQGVVYARWLWHMPLRERLLTVGSKKTEEFDEVELEQHDPNKQVEELADVYDVAILILKTLGEPYACPAFFFFRYDWNILLHEIALGPDEDLPDLERRVAEAARATIAYLPNFGAISAVTAADGHLTKRILQASLFKNRIKGAHNGLYAEAILLPSTDEWCPYFAEKFEEIFDFSTLNPSHIITADQVRHPPR